MSFILNPGKQFYTSRAQKTIDEANSYFKIVQSKRENISGGIIDFSAVPSTQRTNPLSWSPSTSANKPLFAANEAYYQSYDLSPKYLGIATNGTQSSTASSKSVANVNFNFEINDYVRILVSPTTAGKVIIEFGDDTLTAASGTTGVRQTFEGTITAAMVTNNKPVLFLFKPMVNGVTNGNGQTVGNSIFGDGNVTVTATTPITAQNNLTPAVYSTRVRYSSDAINNPIYTLENASSPDMFIGSVITLKLKCLASVEYERNLETANVICQDIEENTRAIADGMTYTLTVNSYSLKMLALTEGTMVGTKKVYVPKTLNGNGGTFNNATVSDTINSVSAASLTLGLSYSANFFNGISFGDDVIATRVESPSVLDLDNYYFDTTTGKMYFHPSYAGKIPVISYNVLQLVNYYDTKALQLSYLMYMYLARVDENGQRFDTEIRKAQIISAKMNAEDANDALELTIKVYPDQEKVLKSTYQF